MPIELSAKRWLAIIVVAIMAFVAVSISVTSAHAASFQYAKNISTPENVRRHSGPRAVVYGGSSTVQLGIGTHTIKTYYSHPGYRVVSANTSEAGLINNIVHVAKENASSECYWSFHGIGGDAKLDCWVK